MWTDTFAVLVQELADYISADAYFSAARTLSSGTVISIPVLADNVGDLETQVSFRLGQTGVIGLVELEDGDDIFQEVAGPIINKLGVSVTFAENPITNRGSKSVPSRLGTLKHVNAIAGRAAAIVHNQFRSSVTTSNLALQSFGAGKLKLKEEKTGEETYLVGAKLIFRCSLTLNANLGQVDLTATKSGTTVTLATSVPHALVYYTTDGSTPAPLTATFYAGPFVAASGAQVKARAWLPGMIASEIIKLII
jgi:hypothetical protein